jgi:two-component system CheB/CheR fusion protein
MAILLLEAFANAGKPANVQIFASDVNQQSIDIARRGVYLASIAVDVSPERLKHYFVTSDEIHYQVTKQVRDLIVFSTQNIINDAPFSKLDLISCRNLLIYLEPEIQQKLISLFHFALVENGHLLLGPAETVGRATNFFDPVSKKWRIYRRIGPGHRGVISLPVEKADDLPRTKPLEANSPAPRKRYKELTESTLRDYSPAAVLINRRYEVLYVSGSIVDYLEFPTGELSKDLLAMARAGLRTRLRAACDKAMTERNTVIDNEARVQRKEDYIACTITARPLLDSNGSEGLVLVILQDHSPSQDSRSTTTSNDESFVANDMEVDNLKLVQLLEYELKSTREELQSTIEEMESANEELQSSNEELESSKEELQSLNEELSTVNCQLLEKVNELDKSNSEITNLMASTEIATLYLDNQFRIKRFTHPTVALFSLVPTDEGRDIRDFASQIVDNKLLEDCQHVLQNPEIVETKILTKDKRCFLRRISPFRTSEDRTDGIVVTFIDLTARNLAEAEQRERDACSREIFEHAATGIAIANFDGSFSRCNPAFCELVGYTEEELRSIQFLEIVHPEDRGQNSEAFRSLESGAVSSFEIENRYIHKKGSAVLVREFVSALPDGIETKANFVALVTDISAQRNSVHALRQSEERIRTILRTASDAIITIDNRGHIDSVNMATETLFGYSSSELVGRNVSMLMPQPFSREHDGYIQKFLSTGEPQIIGKGREVVCRRKDGSTFPADLAINQVDHLGLFTGILRDLSSRKEMQKHILDIASDEQRRIGLELHDGTQQELTGLSLYASALQDTIHTASAHTASAVEENNNATWHFDAANFDRLRTIADLLSKRIAETNQHVRDLAHGIMPVQIDAEGLRSALIELASSVSSGEKCSCVFECEGDISIPNNTTATHLFRIAQEAINNALRHGSASRIKIFLLLQDDRICLEVSDNGSGFDNEAQIHGGLSTKGMGMRTMHYRASLIGGRVQIQQGPDGDTLVRCEILKRRADL